MEVRMVSTTKAPTAASQQSFLEFFFLFFPRSNAGKSLKFLIFLLVTIAVLIPGCTSTTGIRMEMPDGTYPVHLYDGGVKRNVTYMIFI